MDNLIKSADKKILIAPSILSADFSALGAAAVKMERAGADLLHCDVMDGVFVPNITFGPKTVADLKKATRLPLDVHLMIVEPQKYVDAFIDAGADFLTIHYEAAGKQLIPTLQKIRARGVKSGAVISPDTPVAVLKDCLAYCDLALLMSVYPGFGGQKFIGGSLKRLTELTELGKAANPGILIEIDGGVTLDNAKSIAAAGADILVAGNTVFSHPNPAAAVLALRG
ncbi:MAG: ribulose-phosphate 3-epimerase [Clostridiales bacterium]|jgi:ribulose-phosphate 3-epimerase|nr:ribulose-phosphate 3-epimerase [Clostridiales bacterium]